MKAPFDQGDSVDPNINIDILLWRTAEVRELRDYHQADLVQLVADITRVGGVAAG